MKRSARPPPAKLPPIPALVATLRGTLLAGQRRWSAFDGLRSRAAIDASGNSSARSSLDRAALPASARSVRTGRRRRP